MSGLKAFCYCSKCTSGKLRNKQTIATHISNDEKLFSEMIKQPYFDEAVAAHLQRCIEKCQKSLADLVEDIRKNRLESREAALKIPRQDANIAVHSQGGSTSIGSAAGLHGPSSNALDDAMDIVTDDLLHDALVTNSNAASSVDCAYDDMVSETPAADSEHDDMILDAVASGSIYDDMILDAAAASFTHDDKICDDPLGFTHKDIISDDPTGSTHHHHDNLLDDAIASSMHNDGILDTEIDSTYKNAVAVSDAAVSDYEIDNMQQNLSHIAAQTYEAQSSDTISQKNKTADYAGNLEEQLGREIFLDIPESISDEQPPESLDSDVVQDDPDLDPLEADIFSDFEFPSSLRKLKDQLKNGYTTPLEPPPKPYKNQKMSEEEIWSLKHYITWKKSNGTVEAYKSHGELLQEARGHDILTLHRVRKLAIKLTGLEAKLVDMCPNSCIAYTGELEKRTSCSYIREGKVCNQPRYKNVAKKEAHAKMLVLPIVPTIKALYGNAETSRLMRHRDSILQQAIALAATASKAQKYSDFGDSRVHIGHRKKGLFKDSRDVGFALSTDGAQLTMKKQSDTWILLLILLNLPPEIRYRSKHVIVSYAIPGPKAPGNIESFLWTLMEEMTMCNEGIWIWDALDSSYFLNHANICMALGDMLGSAKLSGMSGHAAVHGDRFSMVEGARSSLASRSKYQYYPVKLPQKELYNPSRQDYNLYELPPRTTAEYYVTIDKLEAATTKVERSAISRASGVSRLPVCAASAAFTHPSFFPIDPFHLFYENIMAFIWDLWVTISLTSEMIHIATETAALIGKLIAEGMSTLPAAFCGPVRNLHQKRNSQYKIYEWMAVMHWYLIPIMIELKVNISLLYNFTQLVEIIEFAMLLKPRSEEEIIALHHKIVQFLNGFQDLYIGDDPEKVVRFRLCVFQLIHVANHIFWYGNIRLGSQATCEKMIGELGRLIRSKKAPFANLANIIYEKELSKLLLLKYSELQSDSSNAHSARRKKMEKSGLPYFGMTEVKILKKEEKDINSDFRQHMRVIAEHLSIDEGSYLSVKRWVKVCLPNSNTLRSYHYEKGRRSVKRSARYFEAKRPDSDTPIFGEAICFYEVQLDERSKKIFCIYHSLDSDLQLKFNQWQGVWSTAIKVISVSSILSLIGIWSYTNKTVHVLRKHPGLESLTPEEREVEEDAEKEEDE